MRKVVFLMVYLAIIVLVLLGFVWVATSVWMWF